MSARTASHNWRLTVRLGVAALVWSLGLVLAALFAPVYGTSSVSSGVNGVTLSDATLVQVNGAWVLILVAIPALVSGVVILALRARHTGARWGGPLAWGAIALLIGEAVLGIMTIGAFLVPAIVLLAMAARRAPAT
jgi:hypothetical protein